MINHIIGTHKFIWWVKKGLEKEDPGLIGLLDFLSYVAAKRSLTQRTLSSVKNEKLKAERLK